MRRTAPNDPTPTDPHARIPQKKARNGIAVAGQGISGVIGLLRERKLSTLPDLTPIAQRVLCASAHIAAFSSIY